MCSVCSCEVFLWANENDDDDDDDDVRWAWEKDSCGNRFNVISSRNNQPYASGFN